MNKKKLTEWFLSVQAQQGLYITSLLLPVILAFEILTSCQLIEFFTQHDSPLSDPLLRHTTIVAWVLCMWMLILHTIILIGAMVYVKGQLKLHSPFTWVLVATWMSSAVFYRVVIKFLVAWPVGI